MRITINNSIGIAIEAVPPSNKYSLYLINEYGDMYKAATFKSMYQAVATMEHLKKMLKLTDEG